MNAEPEPWDNKLLARIKELERELDYVQAMWDDSNATLYRLKNEEADDRTGWIGATKHLPISKHRLGSLKRISEILDAHERFIRFVPNPRPARAELAAMRSLRSRLNR